jgi:class 3 adenylate cyclase
VTQTAGPSHKVFRRARIWVALPIAFALGAAAAAFTIHEPIGRGLELRVSDAFRALASLPDETNSPVPVRTMLLAVDDGALRQFGHWPWSWSRMGDLVRLLDDLGAQMTVLDIEFIEEDPPRIVDEIGPDGKPRERVDRTVSHLVESIRTSGNVLVPFSLYIRGRPGEEKSGNASAEVAAQAAAEQASPQPAPVAPVAVPPILERHAVRLAPGSGPGAPGAPALHEAEGFQPMIAPLGQACAGSGYTSILHDEEDGKVRRVPLVVRGGGKVFPHLMLEAAGLWRFGPGYQVRIAEDRFYIESAAGTDSVSVPVGPMAQMELRWPRSLDAFRVSNMVSVIPFVAVLEDRRRYDNIMAQLDNLFPAEGWAATRQPLDDARRTVSRDAAGKAEAAKRIRDLQAQISAIEERLAMNLASAAGEPKIAEADDERSRRIKALAGEPLKFIETYYDKAEGMDTRMARLRERISGRICVVGHYASGMDLHPTPIGNDVPGVTVYPAGIQAILSGMAFRHRGHTEEWFIIILAAGLVATTLHLSTWRGVAATVGLSLAVVAVAALAANQAALLLPVAGPVLGIVMAFAGVTTYRQLTEARGSRWITRAFQQYLSEELLDEIQRDPESLRLGGERREITFLFSDIAGFTTMSENLEPERLVSLLNHYLSAMTNIVKAEKAKLDKYEGDAILALFGAPVLVPDHALRAVRAALGMQAALPGVNDELIRMGLISEGTRLGVRIGCSSGPAIVGNFGSENHTDYTAMGDTVNLGARLEEANRYLGSKILVPEPTAAACGRAILFRRFGPARIRGKNIPAVLYEPLAVEPAPADLRALADAFGRAIGALQAKNLDAAEAALAELLAAHPNDKPALILKERIVGMRAGREAPDEPWNLAKPK